MKKVTIVMLVLLALGAGLAIAGFSLGGMKSIGFERDGVKILESGDEREAVSVNETFDAAAVKAVRVDLPAIGKIEFREGEALTVQGRNYKDRGGLKAGLKDGVLVIERSEESTRGIVGLDFRGISEEVCAVTITYPAGQTFDSADILSDFTEIAVAGLAADAVTIDADSGNIAVADVVCRTLSVDVEFGNVDVIGTRASDSLTVQSKSGACGLTDVKTGDLAISANFGDCRMKNVEANRSAFKGNSGDWTAEGLTSGKALTMKCDFGSVSFSDTALNGTSDFEIGSGDFSLGLRMNRDDVRYEIDTDAGEIQVDGKKQGSPASGGAGTAKHAITINSDFGSVKLRFAA
ncbi:MAG: DUF4097 domain-containing protein [Clostridiales Family XIII bacterium]|jgi:DUF4097 and DUF4098 domain-containing protein YvlB|nr:DUF4097 domain-containing protein [Clostridiales Family XIII bacterium]